MKRENRMILELCRFADADADRLRDLMDGSLDYPYILGQLLYNRMGGAAYHTLKHTGLMPRVNREFRNTLEAVFEQNRLRTNSYRILLDRMGTMLKDAAFPYALLKGALLAGRYPVGLRTSNDLDILVEARDIPALSAHLREHGFVQGYLRAGEFHPATRLEIISSRMNRGETVPFVQKVDLPGLPYWEIDINFSLDYQARETGAVAGCWKGGRSGSRPERRRFTPWIRRIFCCISARICIKRPAFTAGWTWDGISPCINSATFTCSCGRTWTRSWNWTSWSGPRRADWRGPVRFPSITRGSSFLSTTRFWTIFWTA